MDGPPNETILETIDRRLVPDEQAKKARGEVFTPLELVREILYGLRKSDLESGTHAVWGVDETGAPVEDSLENRVGGIPIELWRDPDTKWLDPANGIGNFPFIAFAMLDYQLKTHGTKGSKEWTDIDRKTHIVEKMLYMMELDRGNVNTSYKIMDYLAPGAKPNICCADTLKVTDDDLQRHFGISRFDVIMGNPPFNPGAMWAKFVQWSLPHCQHMTFVLPSSFTTNKTGAKMVDLLKSNGLHRLRFIHPNEFPGINVDMLYLATDVSNTSKSILINNQVSIGYTDPLVDYTPRDEELSLFRKLQLLPKLKLYRGKNKTLSASAPVETDLIKVKEDADHPYKMLSRLGGGTLQYYWLKTPIREENTMPKIVFPRATGSYNSHNTLINFTKDIVFTTAVEGDMLLSDSLMYLPMKSIDDYSAYRFYILRSKLVRLIFLRMNHLTELTPPLFNYIPEIPVESMSSDKAIYDAVGLSEAEREYIDTLFATATKKKKAGTRTSSVLKKESLTHQTLRVPPSGVHKTVRRVRTSR